MYSKETYEEIAERLTNSVKDLNYSGKVSLVHPRLPNPEYIYEIVGDEKGIVALAAALLIAAGSKEQIDLEDIADLKLEDGVAFVQSVKVVDRVQEEVDAINHIRENAIWQMTRLPVIFGIGLLIAFILLFLMIF